MVFTAGKKKHLSFSEVNKDTFKFKFIPGETLLLILALLH